MKKEKEFQKGWYKESRLKMLIEQAKVWATQMGHEGDIHRDEVAKLVIAGIKDY
jgi:hypothetical protein